MGKPIPSLHPFSRGGSEKTHPNYPPPEKTGSMPFTWFNNDTQYAPFPKEGNLSAMIDGVPSRNACRCLCHLEVCQLLKCKDWVVYPEGLNRNLEASGRPPTSVDSLQHHHIQRSHLRTYLYLSHYEGPHLRGLRSRQNPKSASPSHPHLEGHAKVGSHTSMTTEVRKLLFHAVLDTSSQDSGVSTPRRLASTALGAPSSQGEDSSKLIATSSQASPQAVMPDDNEHLDQTSKGALTPHQRPWCWHWHPS